MSVGLSHSSSVSRTQEALPPEVRAKPFSLLSCRMGSTIPGPGLCWFVLSSAPFSGLQPPSGFSHFLSRSAFAQVAPYRSLEGSPALYSQGLLELRALETPKQFGPVGSCLLPQCEQQKGQEKEKHPGPPLKSSAISLTALH